MCAKNTTLMQVVKLSLGFSNARSDKAYFQFWMRIHQFLIVFGFVAVVLGVFQFNALARVQHTTHTHTVCTHTYAHTHTHIHTYTQTYVLARTHTHTHTFRGVAHQVSPSTHTQPCRT